MPRFIISVVEMARVQYSVSAKDEAEARHLYDIGQVTKILVDEHDSGDISDVTEIGA